MMGCFITRWGKKAYILRGRIGEKQSADTKPALNQFDSAYISPKLRRQLFQALLRTPLYSVFKHQSASYRSHFLQSNTPSAPFYYHNSPRASTTKTHRIKNFSWGTVSPGSPTTDMPYMMIKVRTNEKNSSLNLPPTIYSISQLHTPLPLEGKSAELSYKLRKQYRFLGFWLYIPEIFLPKLKSLWFSYQPSWW